jgi:predicted DNA-binding transcriptional regulator
MGGRIGSRRIARLILCLSALIMASLWQGPALAIDLPPPLEDIKEDIEEKIEDIKDEIEDIEDIKDEIEPEIQDVEQEIQGSSSQIPLQTQGIGDSEDEQSRSQDGGAQSERSEPRSQQAEDDGDLGAIVGAGHGIGGPGGGGLSFFCTRGEALCYSVPIPIQQPVVEQPRAGGGLEFTGLDLQRAIAVFFIFAGAGTILLAWDARSRAALIDRRGSAVG